MTAPLRPTDDDGRLKREIEHGQYLNRHGADRVWNWDSPAGRVRAQRRAGLIMEGLRPGMDVLEVGCGTGLFTAFFIKADIRLTALDLSPDLLAVARVRLSDPRLTFREGNAYALSGFADESLDMVIGNSILHHLELDTALKEFYRVLKKGGRLAFAEPNLVNPQIFLQKNLPLLKRWAGDSPDETAFARWSLARRIRSRGFSECRIIPFDFLHPLIPSPLIPFISTLGRGLEALPILREFAGSLIIHARK